MEKRCGNTVLNCNERCWPLQFIAVVANCNAKRVPRPRHCIAVQCYEAFFAVATGSGPLLCTRSAIAVAVGPVLIFLVCSRWAARRLVSPLPGSCAAATGTEALRVTLWRRWQGRC